jgi:ribose transport system permease protein
MAAERNKILLPVLQQASLLLCVAVLAVFGWLSPKFLEMGNLVNILVQSSSIAIVAVGMTFVLLTAGIDLSVGSVMFISVAVAGKVLLNGWSLALALAAIVGCGLLCGLINALFITRLKILPFIVTLATLYAGRGFGLWLTETRAMNLPENLLRLGTAKLFGVPVPVLVFAIVLVLAHLVLQRTPVGRQIYAVGNDREAARKAGIHVERVLLFVYVVCGLCAAIGGLVSVAQLGAVSPTFGNQREFAAIAAAVLGGTSLFGGRGRVFPGTVLGAVLIQTVENGLVIINADPYLYPLVLGAIIFLAVFCDSLQHRMLARLKRRWIRVEAQAAK